MLDLICVFAVLFLISKAFVHDTIKGNNNREQAKIDGRKTYTGGDKKPHWTETGEECYFRGHSVFAKDGTLLHDYQKEQREQGARERREWCRNNGNTFYREFDIPAEFGGYYARKVDDNSLFFMPIYRVGGKPYQPLSAPRTCYPVVNGQVMYGQPWDRVNGTMEYRPR